MYIYDIHGYHVYIIYTKKRHISADEPSLNYRPSVSTPKCPKSSLDINGPFFHMRPRISTLCADFLISFPDVSHEFARPRTTSRWCHGT